MPNLDRAPSAAVLTSFHAGLLRALRAPLDVEVEGEPVRLDPHFRAGDAVALYAGQRVVLTLRVHADGRVTASAHEAYGTQPCAGPLMRTWSAGEASGFEAALGSYLAGVQVGSRWVRREGRVLLRWMGLDAAAQGAVPWVPIDREVVLGHASARARAAARLDEGLAAARAAVDELALRKGWPEAPKRGRSHEVDQLGVSADGRRVMLVELEPRAGDRAYYAPLQLHRSFVEWQRAWAADAAGLAGSLDGIARARAAVGFGPELPPVSPEATLVPVIAFNDPPSTEVLARLYDVVDALRSACGEAALPGLEVWAWPERAAPRTLARGDGSTLEHVRPCKRCGAVARVRWVYGMPTEEAEEMAQRGELALGGCMVFPGQSRWHCLACGAN